MTVGASISSVANANSPQDTMCKTFLCISLLYAQRYDKIWDNDTDFNVKALYDVCYVIYSCSTHIRRDVS